MNENVKELEVMEEDTRVDEVLSIYQNVYNALSITVNSIAQLGELGLTDEDITKINNCKSQKVDELFKLVNEVEYFVENQEEIFNGLI